MPGDVGGLLGGLGSAVGDLFGAAGDAAEAKAYKKAAGYAQQNALIAKESSAIQEVQASRKINMTIGAQRAAVGGAGLAESGTALDLLRSSQEQGALTKQLIAEQGQINVNGYEQEAAAYSGMASAASAASTGGLLGGLLKGAGAVASFLSLSDERLKEDIQLLGPSGTPGINRYSFRYIGGQNVFEGVMAQEVRRVRPDAVRVGHDGFLMVDYGAIGEQLRLAA